MELNDFARAVRPAALWTTGRDLNRVPFSVHYVSSQMERPIGPQQRCQQYAAEGKGLWHSLHCSFGWAAAVTYGLLMCSSNASSHRTYVFPVGSCRH